MTRTAISVLNQTIVVTEDAVQYGPEGLFTYAFGNDDPATVQAIVVEYRSMGYVAVGSGLRPKQRVTFKGLHCLQKRTPVSVTLANTDVTLGTYLRILP